MLSPPLKIPRQPCTRRTFAGGLALLLLARSLSAQQRPHRIVSTAPSLTEALFALGLGPQVVGVSQYCEYPPQVKSLPRVGSYIKPNLEAIARLAPDLVVLETAPPELTERLTALHIPFVQVPAGTLNDVFTGIDIIAKSAAIPDRADPVIRGMKSALEAIRTKARAQPSPSVLAILGRRPGTLTDLIAVGPNNYVNELLEIAGGRNLLAKPGLPRYPHIAMETIIRENPDVIVDLSTMEATEAEHLAERPALLALWRQNPTLKAARDGRIFTGTTNVLVVPGPRAPLAAEILFNFLHQKASQA